MKPSLGRIVLYRIAGTEEDPVLRPAIVVRTWPGADYINLQVLLDGTNDDAVHGVRWPDGPPVFTAEEIARGVAWKTSVHEGKGQGTWRWPERA